MLIVSPARCRGMHNPGQMVPHNQPVLCRRSSTVQEGSPSLAEGNPDFKLPLPCGHVHTGKSLWK